MRILITGGAFFIVTGIVAMLMNQFTGFLIHPYFMLASFPIGMVLGYLSKFWLKTTPKWIRDQMVEADPVEE